MLRSEALKRTRPSKFLSKGPGDYKTLKDATTEYVRNCGAFMSIVTFKESRTTSSPSAAKTTRDDVKYIESRLATKLDVLSEQFDDRTLTLNKKSVDRENLNLFRTYFQKERHY